MLTKPQRASAVLIVATTLLVGCSGSAAKTHVVQGRVEVPGGDAKQLAGHTIEIALEADPRIRAAGEIQPDGSFELETVLSGAVIPGALAGDYKARIVLSDDDPQQRNLAAKAVHPRYLQFDKSGLQIHVPAEESVPLKLLRR